MSDDKDSNKEIDISIIIRISLIKKGFYVLIELGNGLKILIVDNLINIKKKDSFSLIINLLKT